MCSVQSLPTTNISLQLLSFKALFLTVYSSISRVSSVARLGPSLQEHRDSVVLHFISLEKQARVGNTRGYLQIPSFGEDPELCPVRALVTYFNKVTSDKFVSSNYVLVISRWQQSVVILTRSLCPMWLPTRVWLARLYLDGSKLFSLVLGWIPSYGTHMQSDQLPLYIKLQQDTWIWDRFVAWRTGLCPAGYIKSFIAVTCNCARLLPKINCSIYLHAIFFQ